jgi:glycolate oxidase iron-sulfur subunit
MRAGSKPVHDTLSEARRHVLRDADLCVKCGLCLPHCPTYGVAKQEGESPRGRIALAQGLAEGRLAPSPGLQAHLASCLTCRACESVCPSRVPYGRLIDGARAELASLQRPGLLRRFLRWLASEGVVAHPAATRALLGSLSAMRPLVRRTLRAGVFGRGGARLARYWPAPRRFQPWAAYYPARGRRRGEVALFLGCVARVLDRQSLWDSIRVLNVLGYGVQVPAGQGCCGAIHLHDGAAAAGRRLAEANLAVFAGLDVEAVVTAASGCGATLGEYAGWAGLGDAWRARATAFAGRVTDISQFLAGLSWPGEISLEPFRARVAVHDPCTLRNVMRQRDGPYRLLARIPDIGVVELPDNARCCGSAGIHMLTHPRLADSLAAPKVAALASLDARILVTSNVGCALHLRAQLQDAGQAVEVLHPVSLLARQLRPAPGI